MVPATPPSGAGAAVAAASAAASAALCTPGGTAAASAASSASEAAGSGEFPAVRRVAIALLDYIGQAHDELTFKRGDTIRDVVPASAVLPARSPHSPLAERGAGEGGLWSGSLRGRHGFFRGAHVALSNMDPVQSPSGGVAHVERPLDELYAEIR